MKRRTKILIGIAVLFGATLALGACAWDTPYKSFNKSGYTVSVRYDANGGQFASTDGVTIVDVFSAEQAKSGIRLVEPGAEERGEKAAGLSSVSRSGGYFLAGWYEKKLETDANGNALDADGQLCSATGKEQAYTYSRWDFDSDRLTIEDASDLDSGEVVMTLYAVWLPYYTFSFYEETASGSWEKVATYSFDPTLKSSTLALPYWEDEVAGADTATCSAAMVYGSFPTVEGKTFKALYLDKNKSQKADGSITHMGYVDLETGTAVNPDNAYYGEWDEGTWFHIYTVDQFTRNARVDGSYEIYADLDFTGVAWSTGLSRGDYAGTLHGNGHTLSNITVTQTTNSQLYGGLFGRILAEAEISNVTFANVSYYLNAASRAQDGSFGLFAGTISSSASVSGVSVSGTLHIGNVYPDYSKYSVGLLCGNIASYSASGKITYTIALTIDQVTSGSTKYWPHKAVVEENGAVTITANENIDEDPNASEA